MIEETEEKDDTLTTQRAELIPGVADLLRELHAQGVPLALVADSRPNTPPNVLRQHGLLDLFDYLSISEVIGVSKPDPAIFIAALDALGIAPEDYGRVAMVGNHLERDVAGANRLGLVSIFFHWNERRRTTPESADEIPNHTVHSAAELRALLASLSAKSPGRQDAASPRRFPPIEIVCHKGANKVAPENTYAAAQQCIDWGAGTVEIDVWTTRDGEMVLMHDAKVDRTTDGTGHVLALTAAEIATLDAGRWFSPGFAGERVPRLADFLRWIKGRARVFIDVKFAHPQQLLDLLYATEMQNDVFLWSGSDELMGLFHELDPSIALKVNVSSPRGVAAAHKELHARIVEVSLKAMSDALVQACRNRGIKVMIYEKEPSNFAQVIAWQPDMVNLDHADLFLAELECSNN
jgi:HAD superfamily hydrolase (TIGR01549 family)